MSDKWYSQLKEGKCLKENEQLKLLIKTFIE